MYAMFAGSPSYMPCTAKRNKKNKHNSGTINPIYTLHTHTSQKSPPLGKVFGYECLPPLPSTVHTNQKKTQSCACHPSRLSHSRTAVQQLVNVFVHHSYHTTPALCIITHSHYTSVHVCTLISHDTSVSYGTHITRHQRCNTHITRHQRICMHSRHNHPL